MRDPNRITTVCNKLAAIWSAYPDLRLGQLILNVIDGTPLYYIEDNDLLNRLEDFYNSIKENGNE